jgi:hypothetical protein
MPQTNAYTRGVKYIKIAKLDSGSVDQSIELQSLTDIRIKFSDVPNVTQYNVGAINEYPTYYLYTIVPTDVTSSADQEILNYKVSASDGGPTGGGLLAVYNIQPGTNTLGYFNGTYLNMGNTPNILLNVSFSLSQSNVVVTMSIYPYNTSSNATIGNSVLDLYFPSTVSGYVTRAGSFTPIEGYSYGFRLDDSSNYYNSKILITQSFATQSSTYDITVLEPYVGENFYNSDCNVLQNNVDVNVISPLYMDVDFTNSPIVAQNQVSILNGTAARAQVQSWNYSYFSNISGRYLGKQQNAIAINVYTSASQFITPSINGFTGSWPGDATSPSIPVPGNIIVQSLDSCIYEVNWGGGGYPENANGGGINMGNIYLVGETKDDVTIIKSGVDIYYDLLAKMFPSGSTAYQYQYSNVSGLPNQLNITYGALGLPSAKYYVTSTDRGYKSSAPSPMGYFYPTSSYNVPYIKIDSPSLVGFYGAAVDNNGYLTYNNTIGIRQPVNNIITEMSNSLNSGGRWFISLYSGSGNSSLFGPGNTGLGYIASGSKLSQYGYPFEVSYVSSSTTPSSTAFIFLKTGSGVYDVNYWFTGSANPLIVGADSGICNTGMLITKADTPTNGLTIYGVPSLNFAGIGTGYILSPYPKKVITENIDYITKTYGNNPN